MSTAGSRRGLGPCGPRPNCVCSETGNDVAHATAPLAIPSAIAAAAAFDALISTLSEQPQVTLQTRGEGYAHLTCRSRLFRFVDDLELSLDEAARCIHVRSASRVGHSDFGVNRRRVERLRKLLGSLTAP